MVVMANIRHAVSADARALAGLSAELGYPASPAVMAERLNGLLGNPDHGIFVAEQGVVAGWIHVTTVRSLESGSFAEIRGLVVAKSHRGTGIGTQLVLKAEDWAQTHGCRRLRVRTNTVRDDARTFYRKRGFAARKIQEVLDKDLPVG